MVSLTDAKEVTQTLINVCQPLSIIVFGSVAQKGIGKDLDLFIIINDQDRDTDKTEYIIHKCLKKFYKRFAIDPFIIPVSIFREYFTRGSPFLLAILKNPEVKLFISKNT